MTEKRTRRTSTKPRAKRCKKFVPAPRTDDYELPNEVLLRIFKYLDLLHRARVIPFVSRQFALVANDKHYYKSIYTKITDEDDDLHKRVHSYKKAVLVLKLGFCCACASRKGKTFELSDHWYYRICDVCRRCDRDYKLITKTTAKSEYLLNETDLEDLDRCLTRPNPHYKCAAPMILYLERDVIDLAHIKHGGPEGFAEATKKSEQRREKLRATLQAKKAKQREEAPSSSSEDEYDRYESRRRRYYRY